MPSGFLRNLIFGNVTESYNYVTVWYTIDTNKSQLTLRPTHIVDE